MLIDAGGPTVHADLHAHLAESTPSTSPSITLALGWSRKMARTAGAISPGERMAVATW